MAETRKQDGGPMANVYDQQFKDRLMMHKLVCDPVSADLIHQLQAWNSELAEQLSSARGEIEALKEERHSLQDESARLRGRMSKVEVALKSIGVKVKASHRILPDQNGGGAIELGLEFRNERAEAAESRLRDLREKVGKLLDWAQKQQPPIWNDLFEELTMAEVESEGQHG